MGSTQRPPPAARGAARARPLLTLAQQRGNFHQHLHEPVANEMAMPERLPPHFIDLVADAALKAFWRRRSLQLFLQRCGVKESFFATWAPEESKRDLLYRLFPRLETTDAGVRVIKKIAQNLAEQVGFPDLLGWEDSAEKQAEARRAVAAIRAYMKKAREDEADRRLQEAARKRAFEVRQENILRQHTLASLADHLTALTPKLGTQEGGYAFEEWFFNLLGFFEVVARRPYRTDGRQIDGSVTIDGTTYLLELKFTASPADGPDVDVFFKKVHDKADNTMGLLVSVSGFTAPAVAGASVARTPLLLMDHGHLYLVLSGVISVSELVNRLRRHASQTSRAYLPAAELGG
jgi:hypothetical protein